jgi:hypothetical protein
MTLYYLDIYASTTLDSSGYGLVQSGPTGTSQYWLPLSVHVGTRDVSGNTAQCGVYVGPANTVDVTTQVDYTFAGVSDTTSLVSGHVIDPGMMVSAQFINGNPGDTAFTRVTGLYSDVPPAIGVVPQVPGVHFSGVELNVPVGTLANQVPQVYDTSTLASGSSYVILPAMPGRQYRLFDMVVDEVNAVSSYHLQTTSGTDLAILVDNVLGTPNNIVVPPQGHLSFSGAPLPVGQGLQIKNTGASARFVGYVTYSE